MWLLCGFRGLCGQEADSLFRVDASHEFRFAGVLVPSLMVGYGTAVTYFPNLHMINVQSREWVQSVADATTKVDNWLQFAPVASVYVMRGCGAKGVHHLGDLTALAACSYLLGTGINTGIKYGTRVLRPDGTAHNSFPSGHTMTAFVGAELFRREFGRDYPWLSAAAYAVAATTGFLRMYNDRHWQADVVAGAGIGLLSTSLAYWTYPYLRGLWDSDGRCSGYVSYAQGCVMFSASLQLFKSGKDQPVALSSTPIEISFPNQAGKPAVTW